MDGFYSPCRFRGILSLRVATGDQWPVGAVYLPGSLKGDEMRPFFRASVGVIAGLVLTLGLICGPSFAFEPERPVQFIIMSGQEGGAEKIARMIVSIIEQDRLSEQPFMRVNKPRGSGAEALDYMNLADDPDHTVMITLNAFFTTAIRQPGLGIDIMNFAPLALMAEDPFLLWVHAGSGVADFDGFLETARHKGAKWEMAGTGLGSEDNILTEYLNRQFGLNMNYVPYQGGGSVIEALRDRHVLSTVNNPTEVQDLYRSGSIMPLVVFSKSRLPAYPDVPSFLEVGGDFTYAIHRAIVGARGMSEAAENYYSRLFRQVFETRTWQEFRREHSLQGEFLSGPALKGLWLEQRTQHELVLKAIGVLP